MNTATVLRLQEEIKLRGADICLNKPLLCGIVSDIFFNDINLCNTMKIAITYGDVASKLIVVLPDTEAQQKKSIIKITQEFANDFSIEKTVASNTVRILSIAIGLPSNVINESLEDFVDNIPKKLINLSFCYQQIKKSEVAKGLTVEFGDLQWVVLDVEEERILLLAKNIIDIRSYNFDCVVSTWEDCAIRKYLNNDFLKHFTKEDAKRISKTTLINSDNLWYETRGGNDTTDRIFLLSIDESDKYFGDSRNYASKIRQKYHTHSGGDFYGDNVNGCCFSNEYNSARQVLFNDTAWWLRSPGGNLTSGDTTRAAAVSREGCVHVGGITVTDIAGIRPALWLEL